MIEKIKNHLT